MLANLEVGHVIRRCGSGSVQGEGCVRFVLDDGIVRVLWADGRRDTDELSSGLEVRIREGRRLVWVGVK